VGDSGTTDQTPLLGFFVCAHHAAFQTCLATRQDVKINREQMREITFATDLDNDGYIDYIEFSTAFKVRTHELAWAVM